MSEQINSLQTEIDAIHKLEEHAYRTNDKELLAACGAELDRIVPAEYRDVARLHRSGVETLVKFCSGLTLDQLAGEEHPE